MNRDPSRTASPEAGAVRSLRRRRLSKIKALVERAAYDVPAQDVAACIMREALYGPPPRHGER